MHVFNLSQSSFVFSFLCVHVLMKSIFSSNTWFGTFYGIFHNFYMFDILAHSVMMLNLIVELQYFAFNKEN
jgi:hypothetical protein